LRRDLASQSVFFSYFVFPLTISRAFRVCQLFAALFTHTHPASWLKSVLLSRRQHDDIYIYLFLFGRAGYPHGLPAHTSFPLSPPPAAAAAPQNTRKHTSICSLFFIYHSCDTHNTRKPTPQPSTTLCIMPLRDIGEEALHSDEQPPFPTHTPVMRCATRVAHTLTVLKGKTPSKQTHICLYN
jgi:hypothetical protein